MVVSPLCIDVYTSLSGIVTITHRSTGIVVHARNCKQAMRKLRTRLKRRAKQEVLQNVLSQQTGVKGTDRRFSL